MLRSISSHSSANLLRKLPVDISAEERNRCLVEFETGRAHINFGYVLKLSHLFNAPFLSFKISHMLNRVAWGAVDGCIASSSAHPQILRLLELEEPCQRWKSGEDLFHEEQQELAEYVAEKRFATSTDRPGEAQHAKVHKRGQSAPTHTEQYQSFALRSPEFEQLIGDCPEAISHFGWCLEQVKNPIRCSDALGLLGHPSLIEAAHEASQNKRAATVRDDCFYRSTMHGKVIYHADAFSLYTDQVHELEFNQYDGGDLERPVIGQSNLDQDDDQIFEDVGGVCGGSPALEVADLLPFGLVRCHRMEGSCKQNPCLFIVVSRLCSFQIVSNGFRGSSKISYSPSSSSLPPSYTRHPNPYPPPVGGGSLEAKYFFLKKVHRISTYFMSQSTMNG